ncbi:MAG: tyrosine-type recombinase/integrase [Clostridiales bacterium]|nr:tyrosine-type recombinase/integrase [Clostridiales bacterium]
MRCKKCHADLPENAVYCLRCGAKQGTGQRPKSRGNGQGTVYQLPNKTWIARRVVGYTIDAAGQKHKKTVSKAGFKTKREAMAYLPQLLLQPQRKKAVTFRAVYDAWEPTHRAGKSTMDCYHAAMNYFRPVWWYNLADIDIDDLQACMDECPKGKRTRQNMKALCGLLYKYAIPRNLAALNMGQYLIVGEGETAERDALPMEAVELLRTLIGSVPYADYIVAQCYLGFRPSELLALDARDYDPVRCVFIGGAKTEAGRNRTVPVSPKIQPIIDRLTKDRISGPVFCAEDGGPMQIHQYRAAFYRALEAAGIDNPVTVKDGMKRRKYTPHSCRHTFATLMKAVDAPDKDKLRLIGHTSPEMLRYYQDVDLESLRRITDAI